MFSAGSYIDLFNSDPQSDLFSGLISNTIVASDDQNLFTSISLPPGSVLMGRGAMLPTAGNISGTTNQITVTNSLAGFTFSLPQDIHTEASPTFAFLDLVEDLNVGGDANIDGTLHATNIELDTIKLDPFEIKVDPTFGLAVFDSSISEEVVAVPLSILPANGVFGSAVAVNSKLLMNNVIEFMSEQKQVITIDKPTIDQTWTLPDLSVADLTFAALEGDQTFTGKKTFTRDISTGTVDRGRINLSTYLGGQNYITGGYTTDADHFLEFYARDTKVFEIRNGFAEQKLFNVYGPLSADFVYPLTTGVSSIGSLSRPFENIYAKSTSVADAGGVVNTDIVAGHSFIHIASAAGQTESLNFGAVAGEMKWQFSGRLPTDTDNFKIYRGPGLAGVGVYESIMTFTGSGANAKRVTFDQTTDSTAVGNGAVVMQGGLSVAKSLNVGNTVASNTVACNSLSIGGTPFDSSGFVKTTGDQYIAGSKTFGWSILPAGTGVNLGGSLTAGYGGMFGVMYSNSIATNHIRVSSSVLPTSATVDLGDSKDPFQDIYVSSSILPTTNLVDIGGVTDQFRHLYSKGVTVTDDSATVTISNVSGAATVTLSSASDKTTTLNMGTNASGWSKWHFSSRLPSETDNLKIYRGPGLAGSGTYNSIMTMIGSGANAGRVIFDRSDDATAIGTAAVNVNGGLSVAKQLRVGTNASIGGELLVGNNNHGVLRLSTYGGGRNRIEGGYIDDTNHYLEFYTRGDKILEIRNAYPGAGVRQREVTVTGKLIVTERVTAQDLYITSPLGIRFDDYSHSSFNCYSEHTYNIPFLAVNGSVSSGQTATVRCVRVGRLVTLDFDCSEDGFTATGGIPWFETNIFLADAYKPSTDRWGHFGHRRSGNTTMGVTRVYSTGAVRLYPGPSGSFDGLGIAHYLQDFQITYIV